MKLRYFYLLYVILILSLCSCTWRTEQNIYQKESDYAMEPTPAYEEIYPSDIYKNNTAVHSFSTSGYDGAIISYMNDCVQIIDINNDFCIYELCHDPTCNHSNLSCLKYASRACTNAVYFNDTIYLNRYVQNSINSEISQEIISYDMKTNEYSVIQDGEFFNLLCRMGKFIYYYENRFVEQLDSGEVKYSTDYYRYDILSKTTNLLEEDSVEPRIRSLLTSDGFIYGLNKDGDLIAYDADFKYAETVLVGKKISDYSIFNGVIYYLSKTPQNTDSGQLYSHDLSSGEDQLIANNVNLFSLDGNIIYYTLYNPAPAFEWDYPVKNEDGTVEIRADGQNKTSRVMIESRHGNEIYTYDIGTGDIKCYPIGTEEAFLGTYYYVLDGNIISQFKAPYSEGDKLGMRTGIGVFDLENNFKSIIDYYRIY